MENDDQLDQVFMALADRRRRAMLAELAAGPRSIGELAALGNWRMSAASKNIAVLEAAGLVFKARRGREVICHMNFDVWRTVAGYIARHAKFWAGRLDELESYIKEAGGV
ncbi:ArsR/SmtB family transcription factor [Kordiimonas gwangyangensis]|uniref:ArsR/SmtB family transcription factor n=1 Tax=Kordiimonas gwangyangensis TaxID=288022 RepID=UPI00046F2726|nr:helix-turn-helix domain-containing protein [Kordiimonas gwangyangensis]